MITKTVTTTTAAVVGTKRRPTAVPIVNTGHTRKRRAIARIGSDIIITSSTDTHASTRRVVTIATRPITAVDLSMPDPSMLGTKAKAGRQAIALPRRAKTEVPPQGTTVAVETEEKNAITAWPGTMTNGVPNVPRCVDRERDEAIGKNAVARVAMAANGRNGVVDLRRKPSREAAKPEMSHRR